MRSIALVSALAAASAVHAGPASKKTSKRQDITPITAKGNAFFKGNERFYVRGIAYQPGGSSANLDPLADPKVCLPDIDKFKDLGLNMIRVYSTDNSKDHSECMDALAEAGIYVALDANNPDYSINRDKPEPSYNHVYLQSVFATIDEFIKYDNTFGFFSGNEVIHDEKETTLSARFVKATTRDMRQYIRARGYRKALVGYSAADVDDNRIPSAHYFNCGTEDERSDFFAFNDYAWCSSSYTVSGWDKKVKQFTGYGIPIFLSEYGCKKNARDFREIEALMSDKMTPVYSGGLMYEYTFEENAYGIINITRPVPENIKNQTGERIELPEYTSLSRAMEKYPAPTGDGGYVSTSTSVACPTKEAKWLVDSTLLPAIPEKAKVFMQEGAGKGPGLDGPGSQNAGGSSTGDAEPGSGSVAPSPSASASDSAAAGMMAPLDPAPFVVSGVVMLFTAVGALLL